MSSASEQVNVLGKLGDRRGLLVQAHGSLQVSRLEVSDMSTGHCAAFVMDQVSRRADHTRGVGAEVWSAHRGGRSPPTCSESPEPISQPMPATSNPRAIGDQHRAAAISSWVVMVGPCRRVRSCAGLQRTPRPAPRAVAAQTGANMDRSRTRLPRPNRRTVRASYRGGPERSRQRC